MEQTECSETSAYKILTLGNYPEGKHTTFRARRKFEMEKNTYLLEVLRCLSSYY